MKNIKQNFYDKMYSSKKSKTDTPWFFKKLKRFEKYREEAVIELLPKNGERLLDVACGEGTLIFKVAANFEELWGIDISKERINRANQEKKKSNLENVNFKIVDVDRGLPFKDGYFDIVTAVAALACFFDPYFVLREIKRVLKKNGVFIAEVPNLAYLPRRISLLFGKQPWTSAGEGWDGGQLHYFTHGSLEKLLKDSGFKIVKIAGSGIFASLRSWWPSLLSGDLIMKAKKI
jgi:ubiquinone/menaquinone biosynthesis C-methylase UbiE